MTVVDNVFPQSGDADFAENFAAWVGRGNISSHVETGLSFTVDYTASPPTVDVTEGKSYVLIDEATISSNSETRLALDYAITTEAQTDIPLNGSEENNLIYVNPNIGSNDSPTFEVETNSGNAGANWLLVGVIDTVNETSEVRNRNPDADYDALTARDSFSLPVYSEFSEASSSEASTIFIDGNGAQREGVYVNDGNSFISVGVREINQLIDVDGVESITSDTSSNRPAAGTQGRLFIDETNSKIQIDTGSAWVDVGTNSQNIGAGDLGFDPATQAELDTHISVSDAHHSRPNAGNGLKESSNTFNIEPSDFAGTFLNDNADNLEVRLGFGLEDDGSGQIQFDESQTYTFPNQQIINGILTMGDDIDLSNNNLVEPNQIQTSGSGSDVITVQDTNAGTSIMTLSEGGEVGVTSGDLTDGGATTIFDQIESHVPLDTLEHDSLTVTSGDGLKSGGSVTLGSSVTLDIEPADFAGAGLNDDGLDNLELTEDSVTITAGTDLTTGGTVALGGSVTIDHADTSTQGNVSASAGAAVTDVDLDGNGHVTTLGTTDFDSRYVTESGDTMSGDLNLGGNALLNTTAIFSNEDMAFNTAGGGQDSIIFQDLSTSTPTRIMRLTEGDQNVEIRNGDLEVGNTSGGDIRAAGELTEGASL